MLFFSVASVCTRVYEYVSIYTNVQVPVCTPAEAIVDVRYPAQALSKNILDTHI